jgi:hypothetical protein
MTGFKLLGTAAMLVTLTAAQSQAYGTEGREVAAPPWSAACTNDQGPSQCGELMWVYGGPQEYSTASHRPPSLMRHSKRIPAMFE